jgi:hypothetical protein
MHRETSIRRSLFQSSLPRGTGNSNRYTRRLSLASADAVPARVSFAAVRSLPDKINRQPEPTAPPVNHSQSITSPKSIANFRELLVFDFPFSPFQFQFLIETPPRIEIAITRSFKRRKHFLIETRNACSRRSLLAKPFRTMLRMRNLENYCHSAEAFPGR